jgi:hypothetical protein
MAIVQLGGLGKLKNPRTLLGIKPVAFQLVEQCHNIFRTGNLILYADRI